MFPAFSRLFTRPWTRLMVKFSMSTTGFLALSCALPFLTYLGLILIPAYRERYNGVGFLNNVRNRIRSSRLETIISVGIVLAFWLVCASVSLTPTDVESLSTRLFYWELAEYFWALMVAVGCAGEFIADFTNWFTDGVEERKKRLAKASTLLLIASLAFELVCLVKTNSLSGQLICSLSKKAGEADTKARTALTNSAGALIQATNAKTSSGNAETSASNALDLARGARQEADSFEKDIVSAKQKAAQAESHLAETTQRANELTTELNRIKTPRTLTNTTEMVTALGEFKGTEYVFASVFQEQEAINLVRAIDDVLQKSG